MYCRTKVMKSKAILGDKADTGFHFDMDKMRVGLTASYMHSLTSTANSPALILRNNNIWACLSIGNKL
jgi:hypothetical protein